MFDLFDIRTLLLLFLVFAPLEYLLPRRSEKRMFRPGVICDLLHYGFSGLAIRLMAVVLVIVLGALGEALTPGAFRESVAGLPIAIQVVLALVVADLGFYVAHWLSHHVEWMWHFHAVHHSSEELDWLAAHRVHPVDQTISNAFSILPIFVMGFAPAAMAIHTVIYLALSHLIHSNVRIGFGPLKWVIASPEFHHWHHANQAEAFDKNLSGMTPLWDAIFGTLYMPRGKMPERYGTDEPVPADYPGQLAYPFVRLSRRAAAPRPESEQR